MLHSNDIFLHFLDREACEVSRSYELPVETFLEVFRVITACSYEQLILSAGHLFEHKAALDIYRRHIGLFLTGQIRPVARAKSVEAFVDAKATQYVHARAWQGRDYSIYFNGSWQRLISGPVDFLAPQHDTSHHLAMALRGKIGRRSEFAKRAVEVLHQRGDRAITVALFRDQHETLTVHLHDLAHDISAQYQSYYRRAYAPWIFAGCGLIARELEEKSGFEYEYRIFRRIYRSLAVSDMYTTPGFPVEEYRGSGDHVRFVANARKLFAGAGPSESWKIGHVLMRLFGSSVIGPQPTISLEHRLKHVADRFDGLGAPTFAELYADVSGPRTFTLASASAGLVSRADEIFVRSNCIAFVVLAARQELAYVREWLADQHYVLEQDVRMAGRVGGVFHVRDKQGSPKRIGVVLAAAQGRAMMSELLEAIDTCERPRAVLMVGMMAGVRGKSKLLDVVVPRTVFDGTAVGTRDGEIIAEPEAADMDPRLHHWVTNYDWGTNPRTRRFTVIAHKKTLTVAAKIDDISHQLAQAAVRIDSENVVGLEMEGIALADRQKRQSLLERNVAYLMVKGVADFAGHEATADDVAALPRRLGLKARDNLNPVTNRSLRSALQREATRRSMAVAVTILGSDVV